MKPCTFRPTSILPGRTGLACCNTEHISFAANFGVIKLFHNAYSRLSKGGGVAPSVEKDGYTQNCIVQRVYGFKFEILETCSREMDDYTLLYTRYINYISRV